MCWRDCGKRTSSEAINLREALTRLYRLALLVEDFDKVREGEGRGW